MSLIPSGPQTVGPFFNYALTADLSLGVLARDGAKGDRMRLAFRVTDGDGAPAAGDALLELWQADAHGRYDHPLDAHFSDAIELPRVRALRDGSKRYIAAGQAPHINVAIFARGLLKQLYTRVYFEGDPANLHDPVLALVPPDRRATLMAKPDSRIADTWSIEIRLQGEAETVFFDI